MHGMPLTEIPQWCRSSSVGLSSVCDLGLHAGWPGARRHGPEPAGQLWEVGVSFLALPAPCRAPIALGLSVRGSPTVRVFISLVSGSREEFVWLGSSVSSYSSSLPYFPLASPLSCSLRREKPKYSQGGFFLGHWLSRGLYEEAESQSAFKKVFTQTRAGQLSEFQERMNAQSTREIIYRGLTNNLQGSGESLGINE